MAAMVVVAVGLFAVIQLQLVSIRSASYAREVDQASQLAMGIVDNLRVRALGWVNIQRGPFQGTNTLFPAVFTDIVQDLAITDPPNQNMNVTELQAFPWYEGNPIAGGTAFTLANLINVMGVAQGPAGTSGAGAIYRVHYVQYQPLDTFGAPAANVRWFTVFVSWDSKDYGDPNHVYNSTDNALFFKRHIVKMPFFLFQTNL
jgi:hypothetical protein